MFTLLEDQMNPDFGKIARNIVFIAGERVLRDPIVVPFSRGCNLLTVYSKKHIDGEPDLKAAKMAHNQRTLKKLGSLFYTGGTCMWFAPSGGRDRRSSETGKVELSPFDANSIEMIRQVADKAGALQKTHFYAMALATHNIFPPPASVRIVSQFCCESSLVCLHLSTAIPRPGRFDMCIFVLHSVSPRSTMLGLWCCSGIMISGKLGSLIKSASLQEVPDLCFFVKCRCVITL